MSGCGLFVTGTDTGVGKTTVAVAIVRQLVGRGLRVGVYKPVASGVGDGGGTASDAALLWEAAGQPLSIAAVCPQAFAAAIAPPASARAMGRTVDDRLLHDGFSRWREASEIVIVEGAGGLFSPLSAATLNADLARALGLPLVVVDGARLGAIGRTLAVVEAARSRGLQVAAVVLSQVERLTGSLDDAASTLAIAVESGRDLAVRINPVPVAVLGHGAERIEPDLDWRGLASCHGQA